MIKYEPFEKDFCIEPIELKAMTQEDVKKLRFELDKIEVHGKEPVVRPVSSSAWCGLWTASLSVMSELEISSISRRQYDESDDEGCCTGERTR